MANTLRFKRGLASGLPTGVAGEPLFTTDTFDLYIGNGTTNTRFQKYIASGATTQILRGDGSLYTFPLAISSPSNGQVLKYNGTSWVNDSDSGITGSGSAGQVAYFTGATTQAGSNNLFWDSTNGWLGIGTNQVMGRLNVQDGTILVGKSANTTQTNILLNGYGYRIVNTLYGNVSIRSTYTNTTNAGTLEFYVASSGTTTTEAARIHATGNFGINTGATDSGQRLQVVGTGYFSDSVGIGNSGTAASSIRISKALATGNTIGIYMDSQIQSTLSNVSYFQSEASTSASAITVTHLRHYFATAPSFGAGSTVTNQYGFAVQGSTLINATNNYGFWGDIAAGTNRWNLYMNGTANNYMAGSLGIGSTSLTGYNVRVSRGITGATVAYGITSDGTIQSDVTSSGLYFSTLATTQNTTFTLNNLFHFSARQSTFGASSTVTKQVGFFVESSLVSAGTNIGFESNIAAASGRWNFYASGTALNYLNGSLLIGSTTDSGEKLQVTGTMKVTGASTFGGNMTLTLNQNATTEFRVQNATSGTGAFSSIAAESSSSALMQLGKYSTLKTAYKIISSSDGFLYNNVNGDISILNDFATGNIKFAAGASSTTQMLLNASGNLGLSVTPSAWGSTWRAIELEYSAGGQAIGALYPIIIANGYNTGGGFFYKTTSQASYYQQIIGQHRWFNAPSGTAGNAITFTQAMTLDASGNLGIGTTSPTEKLLVSSSTAPRIAIQSTTNSNNSGLYFLVKNSSGTTQSGGVYYIPSTTPYLTLTGDNASTHLNVFNNGNILINSTTDSGEKLQVTGTAKITGATVLQSTLSVGVPSSSNGVLYLFNATNTGRGEVYYDGTNNYLRIESTYGGSGSFRPMSFWAGGSERMQLSNNGNLVVDTNTLFVDATNNRVGIGTASPTYTLHTVVPSATSADIFIAGMSGVSNGFTVQRVSSNFVYTFLDGNVGIGVTPTYKLHVQGTGYFNDNVRFPNLKGVVFVQSGGSLLGSISMDSSNQVTIDNNGFFGLSVGTSYNLLGGNTGIGTSSFGTSATRTFAMLNGTAPTSSPVDSFQLYSNDVTAGNAAPHIRTENGAVIKLYQETTAVGNSIFSQGGGNSVLDDSTFDGYTLRQIVKALRNQGILA